VTETFVERRRRLIRDEIGRVAIELFAARGFDAVTVDDIADAAGTSQRTFFRYFATKDDIVLALARRLDERLVDALDARPAQEGAVAALREAYCATSHVEPAERERVLQVAKVLAEAPALRARAHGEYVGENGEIVARLAARMGLPVDDRRVRVPVATFAAVASVEFTTWAEAGGAGDPSEAIRASLALLEDGLSNLDAIRRKGRSR
jgi:AcrR family transcriptional regulator